MSLSGSTVWHSQAICDVLWISQPGAPHPSVQTQRWHRAPSSILSIQLPPALRYHPSHMRTQKLQITFFCIFFPGLLTPAAAFLSCYRPHSGCSAPDTAKAIAEDGRSAGRRKTQQPRREGICSLLKGTLSVIMPAKRAQKSSVIAMVIISHVWDFLG